MRVDINEHLEERIKEQTKCLKITENNVKKVKNGGNIMSGHQDLCSPICVSRMVGLSVVRLYYWEGAYTWRYTVFYYQNY